jgi:methylated-DNA-[protein]-cysteine S-methyltransferase
VENSNTLSAAVYAALMKIPRGRVTTYGDIAKIIGRPKASRAVGRILNRNPNPVKVPCHRVVMSDGTIGGYAYGKSRKKELLESEGLCFAGDSVVEFNRSRLDAAGLV